MSEQEERSNFREFKRLNILLVVSSYLPNLGGLQSVTSQLAGELERRGHHVEVLTQRYPRGLAAEEIIGGIRVQRWHFLTPRWRYLKSGRVDLLFAGLVYFPLTILRLLWRIARDKPDVVNLHFVGAPAVFLLIARSVMRFRFVVSLHGDDVEGLLHRPWVDRWVFRATLRRTDAVTACSRYLIEHVRTIEPSIEAKAQIVYNGTDVACSLPLATPIRSGDFRPSREGERAFTLLAVGRMVPKKGFDILLKSYAMIERDEPCVRLMLVGDGPEYGALQLLARDLGIDGKIEWRGVQKHEAVIQSIEASDLVVVPSRAEPFGLVALEAMASGKPVVATRVGGLPEVLDGADAVLVEPDNPPALARAIQQVLTRLEHQPDYGRRNREPATRFSIMRMLDEYQSVYYSVTA